jgi:protoporphyrinogen IX oxidase
MLWVKTFHILFVISWFAGIFYLPRIFVNLAMTDNKPDVYQHLLLMARKLYRFITPFMLLTLISGGWLVSYSLDYYMQSGWFHAKVGLVVLITVYHVMCGNLLKKFEHNKNTKSHVFYRVFNELPVFALLGVLIFVVIRPF